MYEAFYGLTTKPFQLNPDPSFYYASKQHRRAKAYLEYGVSRNEGRSETDASDRASSS